MGDTRRKQDTAVAALAGAAAAILGAGLGELAAALFAPASSPFAVIGGAIIDAAPPWGKDLAIALFGTNDKIALLTGIGIVLILLAGLAGILQLRKPPWGLVILGAFGVVGAVVALTRSDASGIAWLPSVIAGAVSVVTLHYLVRMLRRRVASEAGEVDADADTRPSRRQALAWMGGATAVGVIAAVAGNIARGGARAVTTVREALKLPAPATTVPPIPAGAELDIPGISPLITPNAEFYRIDTALVVPQVDPASWRLRIHGMVEEEVELTWDELLALPLEESTTTLTCVSNNVGGDLIGNAVWLGCPLRELLARARPTADADMVLSTSVDGFTAGTPLEALTDDRDAILAIGMNGEPLPPEHGFPVRMVVPGLYGYVSATKWVVDLEVTRFDQAEGYWTPRGWSALGPIKLQSRIDVPRSGVTLPVGETVIAGVAWQQHVGVAGVEVKIDDGPWQQAELATAISDDTWVQWSIPWDATDPGQHTIRCRATNVDGETQTSDQAPPAPNGATGWHTIIANVS
ncbi:molybdopterin-dependent oxidoreductase [Microbacterium schleiferi]|uniref:Molybdopterin-dependent oxidoreductase n=1 Tax=Microbacterium schleiferi TaxID=69362 RepID=A0A7S8MW05_9MICO|nr:molybdopterin-dependent oxidoreductase [Microbacterium schleiferi]QPE04319.1 molybdopterin-dependent oxidoreductase [Microbacterium schleiferi]